MFELCQLVYRVTCSLTHFVGSMSSCYYIIIKQILFGELLNCFHSLSGSWIIMRLFEPVTSESNERICDEFNCPILELTNNIHLCLVSQVLTPVSIVHSCTESCKFKTTSTMTRLVEREQIPIGDITFEHDWTNSFYCLNIYNINTSFTV